MFDLKNVWQELNSKTMALIALAFIVVIAVYWRTFYAMAEIWIRSDTFAHGLIVLPTVVYLLIRERNVLGAIRPEPYLPGIGPLVVLALIWVASRFLGVNAAEQFAAVGLIPATVLTLAGPAVVRTAAFPLAFLFFSVPFGEFLIPQLMEITADLTTVLLQLTGFPVYREGLFLAVPGGDFEVATACSGIRYLIASIVLGTIFAYLTFTSIRKRLIFIGFSILVPIIANGIRAYLIVVLASLSGMRLAVGVDHLIYGWLFFGFVMFILFGIGVRYRDDMSGSLSTATNLPATPSVAEKSVAVALVAALAVMLVGPSLLYVSKARAGAGAEVLLASPLEGWVVSEFDSPWLPAFQPSDQSLRRAVTDGVTTIYEFVDVYRTTDGGVDATSSGNSLVDKKVWRIAQILPESDESMRLLTVTSGKNEMYIATWYQIGSRRSASPVRAKLFEAWEALRHGGTTSAIVVFAVDDEKQNIESLLTYLTRYYPALSDCLANPDAGPSCDD